MIKIYLYESFKEVIKNKDYFENNQYYKIFNIKERNYVRVRYSKI